MMREKMGSFLRVSPTQLTLNGWGFIRNSEIVMETLSRPSSHIIFFTLFEVCRQPKTGSKKERLGQVGLRCNQKRDLFAPVNNSNKDFKDKLFYVRPMNGATNMEVGEFDEKGPVLKPLFPLPWTKDNLSRTGPNMLGIQETLLRKMLGPCGLINSPLSL